MAGILAKIAARVIIGVGFSPFWIAASASKTGWEMYDEWSEVTAEDLSHALNDDPERYAELERDEKLKADESVAYWSREWRRKQGK